MAGLNFDWTISYAPGATTRSIVWNGKEVALVNPSGDFTEDTEADLAAGLAFAGRMHNCLKMINTDLRNGGVKPETAREISDILVGVHTIDPGRYDEDAWEEAATGGDDTPGADHFDMPSVDDESAF